MSSASTAWSRDRDHGPRWIALHAGIAGGADVILIPEIPFELDEVARVCVTRHTGGPRFTIVVAAEGAAPAGGAEVVRAQVASSADPVRLGGIASWIALALETRVAAEVRAIALGHIQRGGAPTAADRALATELGSHAADLVARGRFGSMAAIRGGRLADVALESVAGTIRRVPADAPLVAAGLGVGVSFGVAHAQQSAMRG